MQLAADQGWGNYSVALSAAGHTSGSGESTQNRWKKFYPGSTSLSVTYNSYPWSAWRSTAGKGCTSGTARTVINSSNVLLSSQLNDADGGDTVAGSFDWSADGGATWHALPVTPRALGGQVFSVTADVSGTSAAFYVWRVRPWDGTDWGGYSGWCEFSVDLTPPNAAVAASTQLSIVKPDPANPQPLPPPPGSAVVGQPAAVTLTPASGGTDVAGYLYGVSKDGSADVPIWVPASADGRVTVPVTPLWADPFVGNTLTVRAKDRAGNIAAVQYQFAASPATVATPAKRGDVTGDGRSDIVGTSDSDGQAQVRMFVTAADGAAVLGPTTPVTMPAGGRLVTGDFNADGHGDIAVFRDGANNRLSRMTTATGRTRAADNGRPPPTYRRHRPRTWPPHECAADASSMD